MKILFILLIFINLAYSIDKASYYDFGKKFDAKHLVIPTDHSDSIRVFVFFRVVNNTILFKNMNNAYSSEPVIEISLRDNSGIIRARNQWKKNYKVNSFEETVSKDEFLVDFFEFVVSNKDYDIEIKFFQSINSIPSKININSKELFKNSNIGTNPFFYRPTKGLDNSVQPYIRKSGYSFESSGANIFMPIKNAENSNFTFTLEKIKKQKDKKGNDNDKNEEKLEQLMDWGGEINLDGSCNIVPFSNIESIIKNSKVKLYLLDNKSQHQFLNIILPKETLTPGLYKVSIFQNSNKINSFTFPLEWESKPISLLDPEFAIDKMYYILNDLDFQKYKSLDKDLLFEKLIEYWKKRDPSPNTPFNEKMTQYFNRVDYSFFNFSTLSEKDGADTDRGKIYILKGSPSKVQNITIEAQEYEIWEYYDLNKIYKFKLIASGVYKLESIEEVN